MKRVCDCLANEDRLEQVKNTDLLCPVVQVVTIQFVARHELDASSVRKLTVRRADGVPTQLVQQHIFRGCNPGGLIEQCDPFATTESFEFVLVTGKAKEVHLQSGTIIEGIELMGRSQPRGDTDGLNEEVILERLDDRVDLRFVVLDHEVDVVGRAGHSPVVAGHRTDQHVVNASRFESAKAVNKKLGFCHFALLAVDSIW